MKNSKNRSLLVVGSVAFDDIDGPFGHYPRVLGGSASFFATAASYFTERITHNKLSNELGRRRYVLKIFFSTLLAGVIHA